MKKINFNEIIQQFNDAKDRQGNKLQVYDLYIKKNDQIYLHHFEQTSTLRDVRSISKTVMTLVLGIVIKHAQAGRFPEINEETFIYPLIKNVIKLDYKANKTALKKVKIKHLLTHTIGYEDVLLMRDDIRQMDHDQLLDYLVNHPIVHEPGTYYLYSNAGFYLLSVVLQTFIQEDLLSFINRELFQPLGIKEFTWEKYGNYLAGATRLWLKAADVAKLARLFIQNGVIDDKQIVSARWLEKMLTPKFYTPEVDTQGRSFRRYAYGYGIWLAKDDFYFGHGTDGQILAIIPDKNLTIVTLANQTDIKPIEEIINKIIDEI